MALVTRSHALRGKENIARSRAKATPMDTILQIDFDFSASYLVKEVRLMGVTWAHIDSDEEKFILSFLGFCIPQETIYNAVQNVHSTSAGKFGRVTL